MVVSDEEVPAEGNGGKGAKPKQTKPKKKAGKKGTIEDKSLIARADRIHAGDSLIIGSGKTSLAEAIKVGADLTAGKADLKKKKIGVGFKKWIEIYCRIAYQRAYRYMKVAEKCAESPELKKLGLTEVYILLNLLSRKKAEKETGVAVSGSNSGGGGSQENLSDQDEDEDEVADDADDEGDDGADESADLNGEDTDENDDQADDNSEEAEPREPAVLHQIGPCEVQFAGGAHILELAEDTWQSTLLDVITDAENFFAALRRGDLVIRLKSTNPPADE